MHIDSAYQTKWDDHTKGRGVQWWKDHQPGVIK